MDNDKISINVDQDKVKIFEKWVKSKNKENEIVSKEWVISWHEIINYVNQDGDPIRVTNKTSTTVQLFSPVTYDYISPNKKLEILDKAYMRLREGIEKELNK